MHDPVPTSNTGSPCLDGQQGQGVFMGRIESICSNGPSAIIRNAIAPDSSYALAILRAKRDKHKANGELMQATVVASCIRAIERAA